MPFESVIQEALKSLHAGRHDMKWQHCTGAHDGPSAVNAPDVAWEDCSHEFSMAVGQEHWYRCRYTVPSKVGGVDIAGSPIHLRCTVLDTTELFLDGKKVFSERYWTEFRTPEVVLSPSAKPGESFEILAHFSPKGPFDAERIGTAVWIEIESVEDMAFHLQSFLHELRYCEDFPELKTLCESARAKAEAKMVEGRSPRQLLDTVEAIRQTFEPVADITKSRRVHLVGHAHIDMNWLWDYEDTVDVCRRDFTTMTRLMKEFPKFKFSQSQAAVYDIAERHCPDVFKKMKKAVADGKWEITAATWTEGDLNMANGESLARHLLYAKKYLTERFGKSSRVCWEPDTFGHPANTPQALRKAGIEYYYHMRTSEGGPRYFHAETPLYRWEGLDGSRILVFTSFYGPDFNTRDAVSFSTLMKNRYNIDDAMMVYGVCDHGGGPTRRDIRRATALDAVPTMPRLVFSASEAFFDAVAEQNPVNVPLWRGEMNPIFDGCYTSHADIKRTNRLAENRLLEAESAAALAWTNGAPHDAEALEAGWRTVCFNQFHDIFDGCSIHSTYEVAAPENRAVADAAAQATRAQLEGLSRSIATRGKGRPVAVWNLQGFVRDDVVEVEIPKGMKSCRVLDPKGEDIDAQVIDGRVLFVARDVPAMGYKTYSLLPRREADATGAVEENERAFHIATAHLDAKVDKRSGCLLHLLDKDTGKVLVRQRDWSDGLNQSNNLFQVEYEAPHGMSAWIIGTVTKVERLVRDAVVTLKATGPVADILVVEHKTGHSTLRQEILFYKSLKRIDFRTEVDWQEVSDHKTDAPMLKVSFRPELTNPSKVTWDIPYGNQTRVADGTEFAAQKWIDVSDGEAGFSLLNDCKHGFSANGNTLTMTCIRTSYQPDPVPDRGHHVFNYSLVPHAGCWRAAGTVEAAVGFNSPLIPLVLDPNPKGDRPMSHAWFGMECEGALVTSLKKAEGSDALIVRLVEMHGAKRPFQLYLSRLGATRVEEVSLVEDKTFARLPLADGVVSGVLGPYEIKTLRIAR